MSTTRSQSGENNLTVFSFEYVEFCLALQKQYITLQNKALPSCRFQRNTWFTACLFTPRFEADVTGALDLLHLFQKYNVHPLTMKCEEFLQTDILEPELRVLNVFETARCYGDRELMDRAGPLLIKHDMNIAVPQVIPSVGKNL